MSNRPSKAPAVGKRPIGRPGNTSTGGLSIDKDLLHRESMDNDLDGLLSSDGSTFSPAELLAAGGALSHDRSEGLDSKVLVLNRAYAAMRVVTARRAFCLLARSIAEIIYVEPDASGQQQFISYDLSSWIEVSQLQREFERERHDWVRTVRFDLAVPRIIRLLGYDRLPEQQVKLNRRNLFARDRNQCQYCGKHFPTADLSIDHVTPRMTGGLDTWDNLVCACIRCNARKGGRTPEQANMKLRRKPVRPTRNPVIALRLGSDKYQSWKAFLDNAYWSVELG
jgi:5-methylcytosine-specific restriction endonuclease McrA